MSKKCKMNLKNELKNELLIEKWTFKNEKDENETFSSFPEIICRYFKTFFKMLIHLLI